MTQQSGRQYDDDLTVGADDYTESFSTQYVDLFEPLGEEDAPIAKLKTIILSIDWEINDDILEQLNDELQDLKDVWAGNKIHLVYLQALEKIGRYIFAEKANAHPNAIKLLLTFYYDLEKIVSSDTMSDAEKKQLLLQDVKKFDQFKMQLSPEAQEQRTAPVAPVSSPSVIESGASRTPDGVKKQGAQKGVLTNLKALVWGIDWEISDKDLTRLIEEVSKLEKIFSESRAKLIFLQGIGALGNYIKSAKSSAHLNAFKLLHSFYEGLERAYLDVLSPDEEKKLLLAEVRKFNAFKAEIAGVATEVVVPREVGHPQESSIGLEEEEEDEESGRGVITPAFSDVPDDVHGFREEVEATQSDIEKRLASFLGEDEGEEVQPKAEIEDAEVGSRLEALFGEDSRGPLDEVSPLSGVDVETEADDDSDEKALPLQGGGLAPALAGSSGQSQFMEIPEELSPFGAAAEFDTTSIPGVDVETEADDDSEEAALPQYQGGIAPALAFTEEEKGFDELTFVEDSDDEQLDLEERLHSFFGTEIEEAAQSTGASEIDQLEAPADLVDEELFVEGGGEEFSDGVTEERGWEEGEANDLFAVLDRDFDKAEPSPSDVLGASGEETTPADLLSGFEPLETEEIAADAADRTFEPTSDIVSAAAAVSFTEYAEETEEVSVEKASAGVLFEPVGDEVEVDALPVEGGMAGSGELLALRESVALIRDKQYDVGFPAFLAEAARLRQVWQSWLVGNLLLQLLVAVAQCIQHQRQTADAGAGDLLQTLIEALGQVSHEARQPESEQLVCAMTERVLSWQQGLIVGSDPQSEDDLASDFDGLTDFFGKE